MYGTDVISILGLAITNNKTCNQSYEMYPTGMFHAERENSINVVFELKKKVDKIVRTYTRKGIYDTWKLETIDPESLLSANVKYSLDYRSNSSDFKNIEKIAIEGDKTNITYSDPLNLKRKEEDSTGFNEFKKRVFQCTDVKYDGVGRVNQMYFTEIIKND